VYAGREIESLLGVLFPHFNSLYFFTLFGRADLMEALCTVGTHVKTLLIKP